MVSESILASLYFFFVRGNHSKSVLYFAFMNFDAFQYTKEVFCLVSFIVLRKVLSDNFSLPIKSISAIFIFSPLSTLNINLVYCCGI
jgi:hypothetical protein